MQVSDFQIDLTGTPPTVEQLAELEEQAKSNLDGLNRRGTLLEAFKNASVALTAILSLYAIIAANNPFNGFLVSLGLIVLMSWFLYRIKSKEEPRLKAQIKEAKAHVNDVSLYLNPLDEDDQLSIEVLLLALHEHTEVKPYFSKIGQRYILRAEYLAMKQIVARKSEESALDNIKKIKQG